MKYKLNNFYNVDCMDLMKEIPDKYFELAIVDPPYGLSITDSGRLGKYNKNSNRWDEQAPTITTRFDTPTGGRFIHPIENRTLSPREAARIQSFPDEFIFYGNKTSICKQIGNAVPPKISYLLARLTRNILEKEK